MTFVDTPGLVDGDMKYAFDVDDSILWLGELVMLLFSLVNLYMFFLQSLNFS